MEGDIFKTGRYHKRSLLTKNDATLLSQYKSFGLERVFGISTFTSSPIEQCIVGRAYE